MSYYSDDFMNELRQLTATELISRFVEAKTQNEKAMDLVHPMLLSVAEESIEEILFTARKTKLDVLHRYKTTMPPEVRRLMFIIEKPVRDYESFQLQLEYSDSEPKAAKYKAAENVRLHQSETESSYVNDCIYNNKGDWNKVLNDSAIQELFDKYEIFKDVERE